MSLILKNSRRILGLHIWFPFPQTDLEVLATPMTILLNTKWRNTSFSFILVRCRAESHFTCSLSCHKLNECSSFRSQNLRNKKVWIVWSKKKSYFHIFVFSWIVSNYESSHTRNSQSPGQGELPILGNCITKYWFSLDIIEEPSIRDNSKMWV